MCGDSRGGCSASRYQYLTTFGLSMNEVEISQLLSVSVQLFINSLPFSGIHRWAGNVCSWVGDGATVNDQLLEANELDNEHDSFKGPLQRVVNEETLHCHFDDPFGILLCGVLE